LRKRSRTRLLVVDYLQLLTFFTVDHYRSVRGLREAAYRGTLRRHRRRRPSARRGSAGHSRTRLRFPACAPTTQMRRRRVCVTTTARWWCRRTCCSRGAGQRFRCAPGAEPGLAHDRLHRELTPIAASAVIGQINHQECKNLAILSHCLTDWLIARSCIEIRTVARGIFYSFANSLEDVRSM
jgi:hypothetical protein